MTVPTSDQIAGDSAENRPRSWFWLFAVCYAALLIAVIWSMLSARRWALVELATPKAAEEWEKWRDDVRQQQDRQATVQRRVPKSAEPPTLVLLRDYFVVSMAGAVVFSSLLFFVIAWLLTGMLNTPVAIGDTYDLPERTRR
jgi:hypothetical protein